MKILAINNFKLYTFPQKHPQKTDTTVQAKPVIYTLPPVSSKLALISFYGNKK